jgi:chromosome partitioning protein
MALREAFGSLRRFISKPDIELGDRDATVIAVTAQKGGVGKTTTAVHVAAGLAMYHERRVLLLDMDAQGHVGKSMADELVQGDVVEPMGEVLLQKKRDLYELVRPSGVDGLFIVPSDRSLNETEALMASRIGKEMLLKQAIRIARTHFDVIVIDCPPNLGNLTVNALVAADQVLIPCDMSILSLDGVTSILETLGTVQEMLNPSLGLLGLLRTRVDGRNQTMNRAIDESLKEAYGGYLFETSIGISTAIAKAQLAGQTIFHFEPKGRGSKAYQALATEIDALLFEENAVDC